MKTYLKNCHISDGLMFPGQSCVEVSDYQGRIYFGFFENDTVLDNMLEVDVFDQNEKLAVVRPVNGHRFEDVNFITVRKSELDYHQQV